MASDEVSARWRMNGVGRKVKLQTAVVDAPDGFNHPVHPDKARRCSAIASRVF